MNLNLGFFALINKQFNSEIDSTTVSYALDWTLFLNGMSKKENREWMNTEFKAKWDALNN